MDEGWTHEDLKKTGDLSSLLPSLLFSLDQTPPRSEQEVRI